MTLMTGTGLAQILPIVLAPILSRLFTPSDFGIFALFTSLVSFAAIPATGRYELAILLPKEEDDALNILILAISLSSGISIILLGIAFFFNTHIATMLGNPEIARWLYWVPLMVLLTGIYQSLNYWFNRQQAYKKLAVNRVIKSGTTIFVSIVLGLIQATVTRGLIIGAIVGQLIATLIFALRSSKQISDRRSVLSKSEISRLAKRYKDFPKYSVPADTINTISANLPIIFFTAFFGPVVAGYFHLTQRVLGAPLSIVASAYADVFKQRASNEFNAIGNCRNSWLVTFKQLSLISILPGIVTIIFAPSLFAFVFGEPWREAGRYAQFLSPYYFLAFIVSPLSRTLYVAEKQKYDLIWQIGLGLATSAGLLIGSRFNNVLLSVSLFAFAYAGMYLVYLWMSYTFSQGNINENRNS